MRVTQQQYDAAIKRLEAGSNTPADNVLLDAYMRQEFPLLSPSAVDDLDDPQGMLRTCKLCHLLVEGAVCVVVVAIVVYVVIFGYIVIFACAQQAWEWLR